MKTKERGFTLIELLVVLAIIGMLVSILIPSLKAVHNKVKETAQRSQFAAIEQALIAFKADYGSYPPSDWRPMPVTSRDYCGAQKLAEALLGYDKMGFHPRSQWRADDNTLAPPNRVYDATIPANLQERKGPYLDSGAVDAFPIGESAANNNDGLYENAAFGGVTPLQRPDRFVFTDVFKVRPVVSNLVTFERVKAGSPILYYKANTSSKVMNSNITINLADWIYDFRDNLPIVVLNRLQKNGMVSTTPDDVHPLGMDPTGDQTYQNFYNFERWGGIRDSEVPTDLPPWPHRPDSFILISAGVDGLYGTSDDITNF